MTPTGLVLLVYAAALAGVACWLAYRWIALERTRQPEKPPRRHRPF